MKKLVLVMTLAAGSALAQSIDFGVLGVVGPGTPASGSLLRGVQFNYARRILQAGPGDLYVELPFVFTSNPPGRNGFFFTPGLRLKVSVQKRVSVYSFIGAGVASFGLDQNTACCNRTVSAALDFGGGFDFPLMRFLSLRTEVRDFVTRRGIGGAPGWNHPVFAAGAGIHF